MFWKIDKSGQKSRKCDQVVLTFYKMWASFGAHLGAIWGQFRRSHFDKKLQLSGLNFLVVSTRIEIIAPMKMHGHLQLLMK